MAMRVDALTIGAVTVERCRRRQARIASVVADIGPQPAGRRLPDARRQDRNRRVTAVDLVGGKHMLGDRGDERLELKGGTADPD
jgi:hypothetical protein